MPNIQGYYAKATEYTGIVDGKETNKIHHLHHDIMGNIEGMNIDHIISENNGTLDNRKSNLRVTERSNNSTNRKSRNSNNKTGYRNVMYNKRYKKKPYRVHLQINGKNTCLGSFSNVDEAGAFAEEMRQKYYGEFAGNS